MKTHENTGDKSVPIQFENADAMLRPIKNKSLSVVSMFGLLENHEADKATKCESS